MESPDAFDEEASDYDDVPLSASTGNKRARKSGSGTASRAKGKGQSKKDDDGNDPASVRKLQNRTAQREFRQRKLQYVKDLEARVEFLSSPKDDQLEILKALLHGFIEENKQLRALLQSVTGFIGSGIGGRATELGFNKDEDLEDFVKRSDRDTLHQLYDEFQAKLRDPMGAAGNASGEAKTDGIDTTTKKNAGGNASRQPSARSSPVNIMGASLGASPNTNSNLKAEDMTRRRSSDGPGSAQMANQAAGPSRAMQNKPSPAANSQARFTGSSLWPSHSPEQSSQARQSTNSGQYSSNMQNNGPNFSYNNFVSNNPSAIMGIPSSHSSPTYNLNQLDNNPRGNLSASQGSSMPNNNYASVPASSSSSFFFDTADPMSMPMSAFTNDFLSEFINTGLTPMFDPSTLGGYNWNPVDHATPSSTTSSQNNYNPNVQNVNDVMNSSRNVTLQQRDDLEVKIANQITARHRARFNLPQGLTPADIINSSPMLSLCYLISAHMRNKAANPNYVLPEALQPTPLQIATPHDFRVDGILSKPLRDALIMNTEYNLDEVMTDIIDMVIVHASENLLDPINIEMTEPFLRKYPNVVTRADIDIMNYWRRKRGEPDVVV